MMSFILDVVCIGLIIACSLQMSLVGEVRLTFSFLKTKERVEKSYKTTDICS